MRLLFIGLLIANVLVGAYVVSTHNAPVAVMPRDDLRPEASRLLPPVAEASPSRRNAPRALVRPAAQTAPQPEVAAPPGPATPDAGKPRPPAPPPAAARRPVNCIEWAGIPAEQRQQAMAVLAGMVDGARLTERSGEGGQTTFLVRPNNPA